MMDYLQQNHTHTIDKSENIDIPYDLRIFLDEFGVRTPLVPVKSEKLLQEYNIWLPSDENTEPPF